MINSVIVREVFGIIGSDFFDVKDRLKSYASDIAKLSEDDQKDTLCGITTLYCDRIIQLEKWLNAAPSNQRSHYCDQIICLISSIGFLLFQVTARHKSQQHSMPWHINKFRIAILYAVRIISSKEHSPKNGLGNWSKFFVGEEYYKKVDAYIATSSIVSKKYVWENYGIKKSVGFWYKGKEPTFISVKLFDHPYWIALCTILNTEKEVGDVLETPKNIVIDNFDGDEFKYLSEDLK